MASLLDQLLAQMASPPPEFTPGYEYTPPAAGTPFDPRTLYRLGRQMGADNLGVLTAWLPESLQSLALRLYAPPPHALGWPYPGFQDLAYSTTGIAPATGSPLVNWALWGYGLTPPQPTRSPVNTYLPRQAPLPPDDPGGWAR